MSTESSEALQSGSAIGRRLSKSNMQVLGDEDSSFREHVKTAKYSSKIQVTGNIAPRFLHSAALYEDFMFVFGGIHDDKPLMDLSCFHFGTRTWSQIEHDGNIAKPRYGHTSVVYGDNMFVFGGKQTASKKEEGLLEDLLEFKFETQSWSFITGDGNKPTPRRGHTATVYETSMFVIGGVGSEFQADIPYDDIFEFSFDNYHWSKIEVSGSAPPPRSGHSAVLFKDSIFIFGGTDGNLIFDDLWEYKIKNKVWAKVSVSPSPPARQGHSAVVIQNSMYIFGGQSSGNTLDVYEFDFDYRKWYKIQPVGDTHAVARQFMATVVRGDSVFFLGEGSSDLDYISIGPKDDFEEELEVDELTRMQSLPKTEWESAAMRKHPDILELRERIRPLSKETTFSRNLFSGRTEAQTAASSKTVLQLIMEYLDMEGYGEVVQNIEKEAEIPFQRPNEGEESRLLTLLRISRRRIRQKDIFAPDLEISDFDEQDAEVEVIDHLPGRIQGTANDTSIWDEPDSDKALVREVDEKGKPVIAAGSLNKLVIYLTSEKEKVQDVPFMKAFLYTYQSFTTPETLLNKLIQRYHVPKRTDIPEDKWKAEATTIKNRVCHVIKFWLDKCGWDFHENLINKLNDFINGSLSRDGLLSLVKQLRASINKLLRKKGGLDEEKYSFYVFGTKPPEPRVPRNIFSSSLKLEQVEEIEIARQLTLIEFNTFSNVLPSELLNKSWIEPDLKHRAPHVVESLNRFQDIKYWVQESILSQDNVKKRGKTLERFIKIAEFLEKLRNYQGLFAVLQALNSGSIARLALTHAELGPLREEVLTRFRSLLSADGDYHAYRQIFENTLKSVTVACIPYLDVILNDILHIEQIEPDLLNGLINFNKRRFLLKEIQTFQEYQQRPYNLQPIHQVMVLLRDLPPRKDEHELEALSQTLEPKKN